MSLRSLFGIGLGAGLLLALPRPALPCSPPPNIITITGANVSDGGQIGPDGPFILAAEGAYWPHIYGLDQALELTVHCAGAPVEGQVKIVQQTTAHWTPQSPLTLGEQCSFHARIDNDDAQWIDEESLQSLRREATYTVEVREPLALVAPEIIEARAYTYIHEHLTCVEEDPYVGSCNPCLREEVTNRSIYGRLHVQLQRPDRPDASSYTGRVRVAPTPALVEERHAGPEQPLWQGEYLEFSMVLGERTSWPQGQICFQAEWLRGTEAPAAAPIQCVEVQQLAELPEGGRPPQADSGVGQNDGGAIDLPDGDISINPLAPPAPNKLDGCSTAPAHGPASALWALLLGLPLLRRRRAR